MTEKQLMQQILDAIRSVLDKHQKKIRVKLVTRVLRKLNLRLLFLPND